MDNKKKKSKKIIVILLIIVIIALLAVAAYLFLFKNNKTEDSNTVTTKIKKSEYRMSGNSLENFDLAFLKLENKKENKIYSPLSIKYALAMLESGAKGDSKEQITNVIGDYNPNKYTNSANLSLANALFIKDTYKNSVKDDYVKKLQNKFNADVIYDSFQTPDNLNSWISEKTLKLIDKMFDEIDPDQRFILVNALGIDMDWNEKFLLGKGIGVSTHYAHEKFSWVGPRQVTPKKFNDDKEVAGMKIIASLNNYDIVKELGETNIRKTVDIAYREYLADPNNKWELNGDESDAHINQIISSYLDQYISQINANYKSVDKTTEFSLYVDDNVKAFAKDLKEYDGTTLQYVAFMPVSEDLDTFVSKNNADSLNKIINNLKELKAENFKDGVVTKIKGFIPKFKFEYNLDLISDLKKLGISDVFEPSKSNLSNISSEKGMYINDAKHKANIEFTQDGIKASAASIMSGAGAGGAFDYLYDVPVEEIDLTFDKPYMFIIRDKKSGEVWFSGTVYNPLDWTQDPDYDPNFVDYYE